MVGIIILCIATIIFIKFYELGIGLIVAVDAGILGVYSLEQLMVY